MSTKKIILLSFLWSCLCAPIITQAQDSLSASSPLTDNTGQPTNEVINKPAETNFLVVGVGTFGFVNEKNTVTQNGITTTNKSNAIGDADRYELSPMFLWRHGSHLLVEFEPSYTGGNTLSVNWADINYFVASGLIVKVGYFVLPVGIYGKRLAAGWINKLPSDPVGMGDPGSDFGVEAMGGFPLGNMKGSYDIAISNGFQLNPDGTYSGVGISTPNNNKTISGRLGLLPLSNSSLEIGVSALQGNLYAAQFTNPGVNQISYSNPLLNMFAFDLSYFKKLGLFTFKVLGQYNIQSITKQNYYTDSSLSSSYTFTNTTNSGFAQISVRPGGLENKIRNVELSYRFGENATLNPNSFINNGYKGNDWTENDICLSYWLSWRTVVKFGYEHINVVTNNSTAINQVGALNVTDRLILQISTEF